VKAGDKDAEAGREKAAGSHGDKDANTTAGERPRSRYISRPVRRAVAERDQQRCAYISADGHRCTEIARLEFHHRHPFALGGPSTVSGLELRCNMHNDLQARMDFGDDFMAAMKAPRKAPPYSWQPNRSP